MATLSLADREAIAKAVDEEEADLSGETLAQFIERTAAAHANPIPWHIRLVVDLFERAMSEQVFAALSFPPRHAKSTTVRRGLAHAIKKFPDRLNGLVMYAGDAAEAQSRRIRNMVRAEGVKLAEDAQRLDLWLTEEEGGLAATGINGQLTGKGFGGILVLDDPIKGREQAESPTQREKAWETFTDDAFTRLEPPCGSCLIIATRWHGDDITGRIEEKRGKDDFPNFEIINLPAIRDPLTNEPAEEGVALWDERFPLERLRAIRATLGPYGWSSLYQGKPTPKSGKLFQNDPARYVEPNLDEARIVLFVDGAGTESTHSDETAVVAMAVHGHEETQTADILEVWHDRLVAEKSAPELLAFQRRHGGGALHIENTRDGKEIARVLLAIEPGLSIELVTPIGDKWIRAQPVAAAWNQARVRVPFAAPWIASFLQQVKRFTVGSRKDDMVDALSGGWNVAKAMPAPPEPPPPPPPDPSRFAGFGGRGFGG